MNSAKKMIASMEMEQYIALLMNIENEFCGGILGQNSLSCDDHISMIRESIDTPLENCYTRLAVAFASFGFEAKKDFKKLVRKYNIAATSEANPICPGFLLTIKDAKYRAEIQTMASDLYWLDNSEEAACDIVKFMKKYYKAMYDSSGDRMDPEREMARCMPEAIHLDELGSMNLDVTGFDELVKNTKAQPVYWYNYIFETRKLGLKAGSVEKYMKSRLSANDTGSWANKFDFLSFYPFMIADISHIYVCDNRAESGFADDSFSSTKDLIMMLYNNKHDFNGLYGCHDNKNTAATAVTNQALIGNTFSVLEHWATACGISVEGLFTQNAVDYGGNAARVSVDELKYLVSEEGLFTHINSNLARMIHGYKQTEDMLDGEDAFDNIFTMKNIESIAKDVHADAISCKKSGNRALEDCASLRNKLAMTMSTFTWKGMVTREYVDEFYFDSIDDDSFDENDSPDGLLMTETPVETLRPYQTTVNAIIVNLASQVYEYRMKELAGNAGDASDKTAQKKTSRLYDTIESQKKEIEKLKREMESLRKQYASASDKAKSEYTTENRRLKDNYNAVYNELRTERALTERLRKDLDEEILSHLAEQSEPDVEEQPVEDIQEPQEEVAETIRNFSKTKRIVVVGGTRYWKNRLAEIYPDIEFYISNAKDSPAKLNKYRKIDCIICNSFNTSHILYDFAHSQQMIHNIPMYYMPYGQSVEKFDATVMQIIKEGKV